MEYTWKIVQAEYTNDDAKGIKALHYTVDLVDGEDTVGAYGSTSHSPDPASETYITYEELTESTLLDWVWEQVDKDAVEAQLAQALTIKQNPPVVAGLPWINGE